MSYESDCNDYAVCGNPFQEAMDYEENSRYDQFDGRDEYDYCGEQADNAACPYCTDETDCEGCARLKEWREEHDRLESEARAARAELENDPSSQYYVPF